MGDCSIEILVVSKAEEVGIIYDDLECVCILRTTGFI